MNKQVLKPSPNEEAQFLKKAIEQKRKLRLKQVRLQEHEASLALLEKVKRRKKFHSKHLALNLKTEFEEQKKHGELKLLKELDNRLKSIGESHNINNEENYGIMKEKTIEEKRNITRRYKEAINKVLHEKQNEALTKEGKEALRKKVYLGESERKQQILSQPKCKPDPVLNLKSVKVVSSFSKEGTIESFSLSRFHLGSISTYPEVYVEKIDEDNQIDAISAARDEELKRKVTQEKQARELEERKEKAALRHKYAQQNVLLQQQQNVLMEELGSLELKDRQRRRNVVADIPKKIFQPSYQRLEDAKLKQLQLENAFEKIHNLNTDDVMKDYYKNQEELGSSLNENQSILVTDAPPGTVFTGTIIDDKESSMGATIVEDNKASIDETAERIEAQQQRELQERQQEKLNNFRMKIKSQQKNLKRDKGILSGTECSDAHPQSTRLSSLQSMNLDSACELSQSTKHSPSSEDQEITTTSLQHHSVETSQLVQDQMLTAKNLAFNEHLLKYQKKVFEMQTNNFKSKQKNKEIIHGTQQLAVLMPIVDVSTTPSSVGVNSTQNSDSNVGVTPISTDSSSMVFDIDGNPVDCFQLLNRIDINVSAVSQQSETNDIQRDNEKHTKIVNSERCNGNKVVQSEIQREKVNNEKNRAEMQNDGIRTDEINNHEEGTLMTTEQEVATQTSIVDEFEVEPVRINTTPIEPLVNITKTKQPVRSVEDLEKIKKKKEELKQRYPNLFINKSDEKSSFDATDRLNAYRQQVKKQREELKKRRLKKNDLSCVNEDNESSNYDGKRDKVADMKMFRTELKPDTNKINDVSLKHVPTENIASLDNTAGDIFITLTDLNHSSLPVIYTTLATQLHLPSTVDHSSVSDSIYTVPSLGDIYATASNNYITSTNYHRSEDILPKFSDLDLTASDVSEVSPLQFDALKQNNLLPTISDLELTENCNCFVVNKNINVESVLRELQNLKVSLQDDFIDNIDNSPTESRSRKTYTFENGSTVEDHPNTVSQFDVSNERYLNKFDNYQEENHILSTRNISSLSINSHRSLKISEHPQVSPIHEVDEKTPKKCSSSISLEEQSLLGSSGSHVITPLYGYNENGLSIVGDSLQVPKQTYKDNNSVFYHVNSNMNMNGAEQPNNIFFPLRQYKRSSLSAEENRISNKTNGVGNVLSPNDNNQNDDHLSSNTNSSPLFLPMQQTKQSLHSSLLMNTDTDINLPSSKSPEWFYLMKPLHENFILDEGNTKSLNETNFDTNVHVFSKPKNLNMYVPNKTSQSSIKSNADSSSNQSLLQQPFGLNSNSLSSSERYRELLEHVKQLPIKHMEEQQKLMDSFEQFKNSVLSSSSTDLLSQSLSDESDVRIKTPIFISNTASESPSEITLSARGAMKISASEVVRENDLHHSSINFDQSLVQQRLSGTLLEDIQLKEEQFKDSKQTLTSNKNFNLEANIDVNEQISMDAQYNDIVNRLSLSLHEKQNRFLMSYFEDISPDVSVRKESGSDTERYSIMSLTQDSFLPLPDLSSNLNLKATNMVATITNMIASTTNTVSLATNVVASANNVSSTDTAISLTVSLVSPSCITTPIIKNVTKNFPANIATNTPANIATNTPVDITTNTPGNITKRVDSNSIKNSIDRNLNEYSVPDSDFKSDLDASTVQQFSNTSFNGISSNSRVLENVSIQPNNAAISFIKNCEDTTGSSNTSYSNTQSLLSSQKTITELNELNYSSVLTESLLNSDFFIERNTQDLIKQLLPLKSDSDSSELFTVGKLKLNENHEQMRNDISLISNLDISNLSDVNWSTLVPYSKSILTDSQQSYETRTAGDLTTEEKSSESLQDAFLKKQQRFIEQSKMRVEKVKRKGLFENEKYRLKQSNLKSKRSESSLASSVILSDSSIDKSDKDRRNKRQIENQKRTKSLYNKLPEVQKQKAEHEKYETMKKNREKLKEFHEKLQNKMSKKRMAKRK